LRTRHAFLELATLIRNERRLFRMEKRYAMAVEFATQLYNPCFTMFSRPVTFYPLVSQPGEPAFIGRGIYDSNDYAFDLYGEAILSDAKIELDIFHPEFPIVPMQGDQLYIPTHLFIPGGNFEVTDVSPDNAGGEITLTLRKMVTASVFPLPLYPLNIVPAYTLGALAFAKPPLTVM
jgi:hypothetical protein